MAEERFPVRRILVALDISTLNTRIINRVVELAHRAFEHARRNADAARTPPPGAGLPCRRLAAAARFMSPNDTVIAVESLARPMDAETFSDLTDYLRAPRMSLQRRATDEPLIQAATRVQHSVGSPFVIVPEYRKGSSAQRR